MYLNADGVKKDTQKAIEYSNKSCYLDKNKSLSGDSCFNVGLYYLKNYKSDKDYAYSKALPYIALSCERLRFNPTACEFLAIYYITGEYVEKDLGKAKHYLELSCNKNLAESCFYLGEVLAVDRYFVKAKEYYQKSCELGSKIGCKYSALLKENGY